MKAVVADRLYGHALLTPPRVEVVPASAIQPALRQPLFLNEDYGLQTGELCVGFRISRLGKSIRREFAARYYDAMCVCMLVRPAVGDRMSEGLSWMADNSFITGEWIEGIEDTVRVGFQGEEEVLTREELGVEDVIAELSRFSTLQQGDIIVSGRSGVTFPLRGGQTIEASLNGQPTFRLRIK